MKRQNKPLIKKGNKYTHRALFDEAGLRRDFGINDAWRYTVLNLEGYKIKVDSLEQIPDKQAELLGVWEKSRDDIEPHIIKTIDDWGIDLYLYGVDLWSGDLDINWKEFHGNLPKAKLAVNTAYREEIA